MTNLAIKINLMDKEVGLDSKVLAVIKGLVVLVVVDLAA